MDGLITITTVIFENFELLDVFGPLEMFGMRGDLFNITLISENGAIVKSNQGPTVLTNFKFSDEVKTDVLLIPGGYGVKKEIQNSRLIEWIQRKSQNSQYVASVCTGAALLAKTGLLDKKRATTNKLDFEWVVAQRKEVEWVAKARWVEDGKYFTSSGISAGIDMSLALISKLRGEDVAEDISKKTEYIRQKDSTIDPFATVYNF